MQKNKYDLKITFKVVQTEYVYKVNPKSIELYINKSILYGFQKNLSKKVYCIQQLVKIPTLFRYFRKQWIAKPFYLFTVL